jgi:hypothetical protein
MNGIKNFLRQRPVFRHAAEALDDVSALRQLCDMQLRLQQEQLVEQLRALRADDPRRLARYGAQVFSQGEEDGMIAEIFRRIGATTRVFVECGVGDGLENNTTYLLLRGWSGFWLDGSDESLRAIAHTFRRPLADGRLRVAKEFLSLETAAAALRRLGVPSEFDLLSLDIDRNTSHVWQGLTGYRPRVVVIEYNASIPCTDDWEVEYDAQAVWDGSVYFGGSLKALERIGRELGYVLVGCTLTGVNAFFVRDDLASDLFATPFTAEHHHEPPRYFLIRNSGHPRHFPG